MNWSINKDLLQVQPLSKPTGQLFYMDFTYRDIIKERKEKIGKLLDNMEQRKKVV